MIERRHAARKSVDLFFNKFLAGHPYLCRTIDLSARGAKVLTYSEPEADLESFSLELRFPQASESIWVWARSIWQRGGRQAIEFVRFERAGQRQLRQFLARQSAGGGGQ
jgi:hypothetical protein